LLRAPREARSGSALGVFSTEETTRFPKPGAPVRFLSGASPCSRHLSSVYRQLTTLRFATISRSSPPETARHSRRLTHHWRTEDLRSRWPRAFRELELVTNEAGVSATFDVAHEPRILPRSHGSSSEQTRPFFLVSVRQALDPVREWAEKALHPTALE